MLLLGRGNAFSPLRVPLQLVSPCNCGVTAALVCKDQWRENSVVQLIKLKQLLLGQLANSGSFRSVLFMLIRRREIQGYQAPMYLVCWHQTDIVFCWPKSTVLVGLITDG